MQINNKNITLDELSANVLGGVKKALHKLAETSAARDESLIIGDKDGNFKSIPAKQLLKTLSK